MNIKYLIPIAILFALGTLLSCNSEDDISTSVGQPLVLYADMPMTRSTVDNQWTVGDKVAVKIGDEVKQYEITDATTGKLEASTGVTPFQLTSDDAIDVTAWSLGGTYQETAPTSITIPQDQSSGYDDYDLLYAQGTITPSKSQLTFYHQLARVVVKLSLKDIEYFKTENNSYDFSDLNVHLGDAYDDSGDVIDIVPLTADFSAPTSETSLGSWSNYTNFPEYGGITMKQDNIDSSNNIYYSALLFPKDYSSTQFLSIDMISDLGIFYYTPAAGQANLESGHTYTYNITVYNSFLQVTVESTAGTNSVTPWAPSN